LLHRNLADFVRNFGQVLVLAEHEGHVIGLLVGKADDINGQAHVHSLFLSDYCRVSCSVGEMDGLEPVSERAGESVNALASELKEFRLPEMIPERVVIGGREAGVKANLDELPTLNLAELRRQRLRVVIGVCVAKSGLGRVEQVLAVNEGDHAFDGRFSRHGSFPLG